MAIDSKGNNHQPKGTPNAGRFAPKAGAGDDADLHEDSFHGMHHPRRGKRHQDARITMRHTAPKMATMEYRISLIPRPPPSVILRTMKNAMAKQNKIMKYIQSFETMETPFPHAYASRRHGNRSIRLRGPEGPDLP